MNQPTYARPWLALVAAVLFLALAPLPILASERVIEVVYQDFASPAGQDLIINEFVPEFEARHPGVRVQINFRPEGWDGYTAYYVARHAAGVPPDIINIGSSGLGDFAQAGLIQPLDRFIADWPGVSDLVPPALPDVTYVDGQIYAMPHRLDLRSLVYRADFFDESGLDRTRPPVSWDELRDAARLLVRTDGDGNMIRQGFDMRDHWHDVIAFLFQAGLDVLTRENTTDLNTPEGIAAFEFMHSLVHEDRVAILQGGSFSGGTVAMNFSGTGVMTHTTSGIISPDAFGVGLPTKWHRQSNQVHINKAAISTGSAHPELAWEWIKFTLEPQNGARLAEATGQFPPTISPSRMEPFTSDPRWQTWFQVAIMATPVPGFNPNWLTWNSQVLGSALRDIMRNEAPVASRLAEAARETQVRFGTQ